MSTPESPLPWEFEKETHSCTRVFRRVIGGSSTIANVYSPEDAKHIVHCVNTHAALVEALKEILSMALDKSDSDFNHYILVAESALINAREALRQAEEGK